MAAAGWYSQIPRAGELAVEAASPESVPPIRHVVLVPYQPVARLAAAAAVAAERPELELLHQLVFELVVASPEQPLLLLLLSSSLVPIPAV